MPIQDLLDHTMMHVDINTLEGKSTAPFRVVRSAGARDSVEPARTRPVGFQLHLWPQRLLKHSTRILARLVLLAALLVELALLLGELHLVHALAGVPVEEGLAAEHHRELLGDALH